MELADAPFNEPVIHHLRSQATPGRRDSWDLQSWRLIVHPDLGVRFAQVSPTGVDLTAAYGVHVLAASGVAAGFVQGANCMFLRLPAEPTEVDENPHVAEVFAAPDWYAIDPWLTDVSKLRMLTETAYQFALTFR